MQRILNFINDLSLDDKTQKIINGQIEDDTIQSKVKQVCSLPQDQQILYMTKLNSRIQQITKPYKLLSVLLFIDTLLNQNSKLSLPNMQFDQLKLGTSKEQVILSNIIYYYHQFLKINNNNYYNRQVLNIQEETYEASSFCALSIRKILEFLKIDFIFIHGYNKLKHHQHLLKKVMASILLRFKEDISIINKFVNNNVELILQKTIKHPLIFQINYAYEKLLLINRNIQKLQKMAKMIACAVTFPRYMIDLQLNRQIEFAINERQNQKKLYNQSILMPKQQYQSGYLVDKFTVTTQSYFLLNDHDQLE